MCEWELCTWVVDSFDETFMSFKSLTGLVSDGLDRAMNFLVVWLMIINGVGVIFSMCSTSKGWEVGTVFLIMLKNKIIIF